jgi:hypothetical protein
MVLDSALVVGSCSSLRVPDAAVLGQYPEAFVVGRSSRVLRPHELHNRVAVILRTGLSLQMAMSRLIVGWDK